MLRSLNDDEARVIIEMRGHEQVDRILQSKMVPQEMEAPAAAEGLPSSRHRKRRRVPQRRHSHRHALPCRRVPASCVLLCNSPQHGATAAAPATGAPPAPPPAPVLTPVNRVGGFAMQPVGRTAAPPPHPRQQVLSRAPCSGQPHRRRQCAVWSSRCRPVNRRNRRTRAQVDAADPAGEPEPTEASIPRI